MNLADYLSELLGQHDEVSVPGLGCFIRERVKGYYNDREARFYPPHHEVKFVPQTKDDGDIFVQYVADKKNISLASSKYFTEKFVAKLREDAGRGKYIFADLGTFVTEQEQLVFKPYDKIATDPAFYGLPPVEIYKASEAAFGTHPSPVFAQAVKSPVRAAPVVEQPMQPATQPEYFEEETERKRGNNVWLVLLITLAVLGLALFGVYKFYPSAIDKVKAAFHGMVAGASAKHGDDTVKKRLSIRDSARLRDIAAAKADSVAADTVRHSKFAVIEHDYIKYPQAQAAVKFLRSHGVDSAKILTEVPGPLVKVSVGVFKTNDEAVAAKAVLVAAKKINKDSQILAIQ